MSQTVTKRAKPNFIRNHDLKLAYLLGYMRINKAVKNWDDDQDFIQLSVESDLSDNDLIEHWIKGREKAITKN